MKWYVDDKRVVHAIYVLLCVLGSSIYVFVYIVHCVLIVPGSGIIKPGSGIIEFGIVNC